MADIKWSAFPDGGAIVDSDKSVGLRTGTNMQFDANIFGDDITVNGVTVGKGLASLANNTAVGVDSLDANTTGNFNTGVGDSALGGNTIGLNNTAVGSLALLTQSTVSNNTAVGQSALRVLTSGGTNCAFGTLAATASTTLNNSVAMGYRALSAAGGEHTIGIGREAVSSSTGGYNVTVGGFSGYTGAAGAVAITTGSSSTLLGHQAGVDSASAIGCLSLGRDAVSEKSTGATSSDNGPGLAIGSATFPVGFRGDASLYPAAGTSAGYVRVKWNGVNYKLLLLADV